MLRIEDRAQSYCLVTGSETQQEVKPVPLDWQAL